MNKIRTITFFVRIGLKKVPMPQFRPSQQSLDLIVQSMIQEKSEFVLSLDFDIKNQ